VRAAMETRGSALVPLDEKAKVEENEMATDSA